MSDAYLSHVVVVLEELTAEKTAEAVERLKVAGLELSRVDDDMSVVEGTIEAALAHDLHGLPNVRYLRPVTTYLASFPPGHPMDRDGM